MHSSLRRWLLGVLVVTFLITAGLYVFAFVIAPSDEPNWTGTAPGTAPEAAERKSGAETASVIATEPTVDLPIPTKTASDPRWAFLLLGYGGGAHEGAYLTDSVMVAIADPGKKTLTLLSLPRDSWVPQLFDGRIAVYNKLNTAYAFATDRNLYPNRLARYKGDRGAGTFVKDTVSRLLGIPIANYMALDFAGFRQMINTVGGIDVEVPDSFTARYPRSDDPSVDPSWDTVRFVKGQEHMNGERAITFARAREAISNISEGSDFARSRRQRIILEAFKNQLLRPGGLVRLPQLLATAARHVDTDYAIPDIGQLGSFLADWKEMRIYQTALTLENYMREGTGPGGTYVLLPRTSDASWSQIRAFVRRLWQDPETGVAMAGTSITVVNATGQPGAGGRLTDKLAKLGYRVAPAVSGTQQAASRLLGNGSTADLLSAQLAQDLRTALPLNTDASAKPNALLFELGSDDLALADLAVPDDNSAPSSFVGIQNYQLAPATQPEKVATPEERVQPTPVRPSATPTPTVARGTPTRAATSTPTHLSATPSPSPTPTSAPPSPTATPTLSQPSPSATPTLSQPSPSATPTLSQPAPSATPTYSQPAPSATPTTPLPTRTALPTTTPLATATAPTQPTPRPIVTSVLPTAAVTPPATPTVVAQSTPNSPALLTPSNTATARPTSGT